jgi:hypothetical protein
MSCEAPNRTQGEQGATQLPLLPGSMAEGEPAAFDGAPIARAIHRERTSGDALRLLTSVPAQGVPAWAGDSAVGPA